MKVLDWLLNHPELMGYVIIPAVGYAVSAAAPALAKRFPTWAPSLDWCVHHLPALRGAYDRLREARRPPSLPGDL